MGVTSRERGHKNSVWVILRLRYPLDIQVDVLHNQ